jgi:hypothetical protein
VDVQFVMPSPRFGVEAADVNTTTAVGCPADASDLEAFRRLRPVASETGRMR